MTITLHPGSVPLRDLETIYWSGEPVTRVRQSFPGDRYDLVARFTPAGL